MCLLQFLFPLKYMIKFHWIKRNQLGIVISVLLFKSALSYWNHIWTVLVKLLFFPLFYLSGISRRPIIFIWFLFLNFYSCCAYLATWCSWSSLNGWHILQRTPQLLPVFWYNLLTCSCFLVVKQRPSSVARWVMLFQAFGSSVFPMQIVL